MNSEEYRAYLVECVKTLGQMIKDNAEDIVGETDHISGLTLSANFDQEFYNSIPELTITRSHLPDKEKLDHLMDIREGKTEEEIRLEKIEKETLQAEEVGEGKTCCFWCFSPFVYKGLSQCSLRSRPPWFLSKKA